MLTLVGRARRRLFHNELLNQTARAAIVVLSALILLLFLGTQLMDWPWIAGISVVAAGAALFIAQRRRPSLYAAAQVIDRRMSLADSLSTAVYLQSEPQPDVTPAIRDLQVRSASELAQSVDVRRAVPYSMPRSIYAMAVMVLVVGSLFALRYGLLGRLDLRPPLARMLQPQLTDETKQADRKNPHKPLKPSDPQDQDLASLTEPDPQAMQPDSSINDGNDAASDSSSEKGDASQAEQKKDGNRSGKSGEEGQQEAQAENPSQNGDNTGQDAAKEGKQQSGKPDSNNENSSLLNKAKDFIQNMLSSLKPPQTDPGNQQQNGDSKNQSGKDQQKQQDKNGQKQNSAQKGDPSQDQQQGEAGQDQQDQSQQGDSKGDAKQTTKQQASGAGNQDGDKRIRQAEELAAMGKITEILGKRSANISGEATVEVQSTNQQLRTAYASGTAQHGQSGGEIDRDEIPVSMQAFVQEYFKQARKPAPAPSPAGSAPPSTAKK